MNEQVQSYNKAVTREKALHDNFILTEKEAELIVLAKRDIKAQHAEDYAALCVKLHAKLAELITIYHTPT